MVHPLDGIRKKIERAEEHLATIRREIGRHKEKCQVVAKKNHDTNEVVLIAQFPDPDLMLSVIIGECLHNLRSALDHLVWALIENNPPHHGIPGVSQFPICSSVSAFQDQIKRRRLEG